MMGKRYRWGRRSALTLLGFMVVLSLSALLFGWVERVRNANEEYAVYSAYLSEGLLNEGHDWTVDVPVQVVVADTTKSGGNPRWQALYLLGNGAHFDKLDTSTRVSYLLRNLFHTRIAPKFVLPSRATVALTSESDYGSSDFQKRYPRSLGLVVLSGVGFNPTRTQAMFYIDHFCGLCGGGRYVLMEKVDGSWLVRGERYTWIS
jgi:hypothetical protein